MQLKGADPVAMVTPKYNAGTKFPFSVGLPLWVCQAARTGRQITVAGPDQGIPLVIAEWMAEDRRYCDKLVEGQQFTADEVEAEDDNELQRDDFTVIKGVGPAVTEKLYAAGILTFEDLNYENTQTLVEILGKPMTATKIDSIKNEALTLFRDGSESE